MSRLSPRSTEFGWRYDGSTDWWKRVYLDYVCGRHSGIGMCCILFFVTAWTQIWPVRWKRKLYLRWSKWVVGPSAGRVMCPLCVVRKNHYILQACPDHCPLHAHVEKRRRGGQHGTRP